jgi:hypothetical protein
MFQGTKFQLKAVFDAVKLVACPKSCNMVAHSLAPHGVGMRGVGPIITESLTCSGKLSVFLVVWFNFFFKSTQRQASCHINLWAETTTISPETKYF